MTTSAPSIAILGAGIIGLSCAWELARRGARVTIYDRGDPGQAASFAAAGMLGAGYEAATQPEAHPHLYTLCARSADIWPRFARELEQASNHTVDFTAGETLALASPSAEADLIDKMTEQLGAHAIAFEKLGLPELQSLEPSLSPRVRTGIRLAGDGQVDNRAVIPALIAACRASGVTIVTNMPAAKVDRGHYDHTLWATGANQCTHALGISPVKGAAYAIAPNRYLPTRVLRFGQHYIVPKRTRVIIGATVEPGVTHAEPDAALIAGLRESAAEVCPGIETADIIETWSGVRPATPDHGPLLGRLSDGDFIAAGHYRNGILLAPVTAQIMAGMILDGEVDKLASVFAPGRFAAATP